jgi:hypothetical protein
MEGRAKETGGREGGVVGQRRNITKGTSDAHGCNGARDQLLNHLRSTVAAQMRRVGMPGGVEPLHLAAPAPATVAVMSTPKDEQG